MYESIEHLWSIRKDGRRFDAELAHQNWRLELHVYLDSVLIYAWTWSSVRLAQQEADRLRIEYLSQGGTLLP